MISIYAILGKLPFLNRVKPILAVFLFVVNVFVSSQGHAQSMREFRTSTDTLVVYTDVPGAPSSDKYNIRVRSSATNNEWVTIFANYTYNRAAELGGVPVPKRDGTFLNTTVQNYALHTSAWSHTFANIEMSKNTPIEVEISAKPGFQIARRDFFKATVHPAQKASMATVDADGKVHFTITNPVQLVIDINGQMDDYNAAINPIGHPVHAISIFTNPVIKKPTLNNPRIYYVEPGLDPETLRNVSPASFDTIYYKAGVHNLGQDIKMYPGKVVYIPGDALIFGTMNNKGVPNGGFSRNGENIRVYGYGIISGAKIPHNDYVPPTTASFKVFEIENGLNFKFEGVSNIDSPNHSVGDLFSINGLYNWTKVITWRANGDGIGGACTNSFIRTQDDCSYVSGFKKNCTFWKDANAALFHMPNISENQLTPLIIEDCDVIYARLRSNGATNGGGFQQRGAGTAGQRNVNVIFRNFRIHDTRCNMPIFHLVSYEGTATAPTRVGSSYKGILFQNISIAGMAPGNRQRIFGTAAAPWFGGLIFDNLTIGGTKVTAANYLTFFEINQWVRWLLFELPKPVTLTTIADPNKGTVTRDPEQVTYLETSTVTLNAKGKSGYVFSNWSGDITGTTNPIDVVVDKNMTITANFSDPDFSKPIVINAPGTGSFVIPVGVTSVTARIWGAGGAGGSASNGSTAVQSRGGGGAGGAFATVTMPVTAGQLLSYVLGAGGSPAPDGFLNNSVSPVQNGGDTSVSLDSNIIALAKGGAGGQNIAGAFASGTGGLSGKTGNIGTTVFLGGNGGNANSSSTGSGGGSAGASGNGGNATMGSMAGGVAGLDGGAAGGNGINFTNNGNPGRVPGAGGSGAAVRVDINRTMKGGEGANGAMTLTFTLAPLSTIQAELEASINVYPNPASEKVFFTSKENEINKVLLSDLTGKILYSANVQMQSGSVDLSGIAKGVYLMILNTQFGSVTKKISVK
jgi:uncharacterized repeat protein (TIGR02543 family)